MNQKMTGLAAAVAAAVAVVAIAGTVAAQARTAASGRPHPVPQVGAIQAPAHRASAHRAARLPSCPSATICAFSGPGATGTEFSFPTGANHSQWIDFSQVSQPSGNPFHPNSIINNSGSDIWVYDIQGGKVAGPYCALGTTQRAYTFSDWLPVNGGTAPPPPSPSPGYTPQAYQPGWFFINFNVNTCAGPVPTPLPS